MSGSNPSTFLSITDGGIAASHVTLSPLRVLAGTATGDESNVIRAANFPVACWRVGDIRFGFDSSFIVPEARAEFQVLSGLIEEHRGKSNGAPPPLSIFGHTDPTGNDEYNKALSGRRSAAIYAALTRRTEIWEDLFSNKGAFAHVAPGDQWGDRAIQSMRTALKRTEKGRTTAVQRQSLFQDYMDFLCIDDKNNPFQVDPTEGFLGRNGDPLGKGDYQGCSEFNPILLFSRADDQKFKRQKDETERNAANAPNRRVVVLLFRPGSRVVPSLWPCPRAKEPTAACRKRFFSDGEKRRSVQENKREFKDKEDTFACRFYHRMVSRSPCERGDKPPLVVALFDTQSAERDASVQLAVFDSSGKEIRTIAGEKATDERDGFFFFRLDPTELPDPVRMEWRASDGERHLAGPCSPSELRDALAALDLDKGQALIGNPPKQANLDPNPVPPGDDPLVEIITEKADG